MITTLPPRLKRSINPYNWEGKTVYVCHDRMDGYINVSYTPHFEETFLVKKEDITPVKKYGGIVAKPKVLTNDDKLWKDGLNKFFDIQITMIPADCEECKTPFDNYSEDELRGLIAHILPKSRNSGFPDVATHPLNRMFLGTKCGCHGHYDNGNADDRIKMNIYFNAVKRFSEFSHLLSQRDLIRAYKYLGIK